MSKSWTGSVWVCCTLAALPIAAAAQHSEHGAGGSLAGIRWGARAIGLLTHATPADRGRDATEAYLTQPNLFVHANAFRDVLRFAGTLNLEGLTLRRGELNAGTWGEGYVDRRHPHTYLHEAMFTAASDVGGISLSLSAGKGFVPFGTDDPMGRPLIKFPANHHLAQILERLVVIGAVRRGPVLLEAATFNGNEPLDPEHMGTLDRVGDSWGARFTLMPIPGSELQVSHAYLTSPEQPHGAGLDQRKWSVAGRYERGALYGLFEFARTAELRRGAEQVVLPSLLGEVAWRSDAWQVAARAERTTRVEEARTDGIFRSEWPATDGRILGQTRWYVFSAAASRMLELGTMRVEPQLEVSHQRPHPLEQPTFFDPETLYGSDHLWSVSLGVRVGAGMRHTRMGRYGAAGLDLSSPRGTAAR